MHYIALRGRRSALPAIAAAAAAAAAHPPALLLLHHIATKSTSRGRVTVQQAVTCIVSTSQIVNPARAAEVRGA